MKATPTLVFIHGAGLGPWTWTQGLVPHFEAAGVRCFAPDLHEVWSAPRWSEAVSRLPLERCIDRLDTLLRDSPGPHILVGHGVGARIAQALVERGHRDGVVLIAPTPPAGLMPVVRRLALQWPLAFARMRLARRPALLLGEPGQANVARVRELLLYPQASEAIASEVASRLRDESFEVCRAWFAPNPVPPSTGAAALVIGGREDRLVSADRLRHTAAAWQATAHLVPRAGHCPMLGESAITVARHIERWLFD